MPRNGKVEMTDKTECGCTDECLHKPGCVFERKESALVSEQRSLVPTDLTEWITAARRDDWHMTFVGSDIRCMLGEIDRLRAAKTAALKIADERAKEAVQLRAQLASARKALEEIIDAEKEFREQMGADWEGGPVSDACDRAKLLLTDEKGNL